MLQRVASLKVFQGPPVCPDVKKNFKGNRMGEGVEDFVGVSLRFRWEFVENIHKLQENGIPLRRGERRKGDRPMRKKKF